MSSATTRSILNVLTDLVFVFDENGELTEWNEAVVDVTGYTDEELDSKRPTDFFAGTEAERVRATEVELLETGEATLEAELVVADGTEIPYEFTASVLTDEAGEPVGFAGVGRDFTEERKYRERLEQRERTLRSMYAIVADQESTFEAQVEQLLDLARAELDVDYGTLSEIAGDDYTIRVLSAADDLLEVGDTVPLSATYCELAAVDEETVVFSDVDRDAPEETTRVGYTDWGIRCYLGAPVYLDDEVYGTFCFYDTTPRAESFTEWEAALVELMSRWVSTEFQRQTATERVEERNETLEQFVSMVSHDLRNPLNVLEGSLDLAAETGDDEHFERCERAVDRMNTLIDDLLVLARAGTDVGDFDDVALDELAQRCWETVPTESATLRTEGDPVVSADERRLTQLLENLFRNAVEHGDDDVTVTVGRLPDGFYVEDDGPGIPHEEREQVFESGYTSSPDGTGFGLDIVERIADVHGWTITLTEGEAGGTRFEFTGATVPSADAATSQT